MSWTEKKPQAKDPLSELAGVIRDNKSTLDTGLQHAFYWSDSTSSAGEVRLSAVTGTARAYAAAYSALSSSDTGRLFYATDTNRLWALTPNASSESGMALVGSSQAYIGYSAATITADSRYLSQVGATGLDTARTLTITFPIAFAAGVIPHVTATVISRTEADLGVLTIDAISNTAMTCTIVKLDTIAADPSDFGVMWRAEGEAAL